MNAIFALPLAVLLLTVPIGASSGRQAVEHEPPKDGVSFDFTPRPDAHQRPYIISVSVDGFTRYFEFPADHPDGPAAYPVIFTMSPSTVQRLLYAYSAVAADVAQGKCESRVKGIASTGKKLLTYYRDGHSFGCTFNYSDDPSLNGVARAFMAIVETLQSGERLEHDLRFDRLGLDAEIDALVAENTDGRAIEITSIAKTLQAIIDDDRVMERVKLKAARLLQQPATPAPQLPRPIAR
jgi:hypothetical protein